MSFIKDLRMGQKYEKEALKYFKYNDVVFPKGNHKAYDFILDDKIKVEVKSDRMAYRTGNLAIEYECNSKPSGITATKAKYYIYFIIRGPTHECFKIPVKKLKVICKKHGYSINGGDYKRSKIYLVSRKYLNDYIVTQIQE